MKDEFEIKQVFCLLLEQNNNNEVKNLKIKFNYLY